MSKDVVRVRSFGERNIAGRHYIQPRPLNLAALARGHKVRPDLRWQVRVSSGFTQRPLCVREK